MLQPTPPDQPQPPSSVRPQLWFLVGLFVYAAAVRIMPYALRQAGVSIEPGATIYPWNFSPFAAVCLFGSAYFAGKKWAFLAPLAALLIGDLAIWALTGDRSFAFRLSSTPFVYTGFAVMALIGLALRRRPGVRNALLAAFVGEVAFFLWTNFGMWLGTPEIAKTGAGLWNTYVLGLPFFRNSLLSTAFFTTLLFYWVRVPRAKAAVAGMPSGLETESDAACRTASSH